MFSIILSQSLVGSTRRSRPAEWVVDTLLRIEYSPRNFEAVSVFCRPMFTEMTMSISAMIIQQNTMAVAMLDALATAANRRARAYSANNLETPETL